jgi:leucyl/phenylalanyl-tRNA--protein transferase
VGERRKLLGGAAARAAELVWRLPRELVFPPPEEADPSGLLAVGGDLSPERLLLAYSMGIFPWPHEGLPLLWFSPDPRWVISCAELHVPRRLARSLRAGQYEVRLDTSFADVIRACAAAPRPGQDGTWITGDMIAAYERLHALGFAHCAEAWLEGELVGGLYGVSLGGCFFGESMFTRAPDASKTALVTLIRQLAAWGFTLFDCQTHTPHVERLGAKAWSRARFLATIAAAQGMPTRRGVWRLEQGGAG